jgi:site-specific DNA recombinase
MAARRAAIYVRISEDKTGAGLGIERQEDDCRALAGRLGWEVVEVFSDNDISAYSGKPRPGYRALLAAIRAGEVNAVICWHTDRLHRSPVELEDYITVCEPRGVPTQTVKAGPLDLASPSGRMLARQLGAVSRFESEQHSERTKRARLQAATAGRWAGGLRPYGYREDGITLIEDEAERVQWMAAQVLAGVSLRSIAAKLNEQGARTSTGRRWTPKAVGLLLQRPRNAGLSTYRGEIVNGAAWPAILDEDTWRGVCAVLTDPARSTTRDRTRRWLLSGLAVCSVCRAPVESNVSAWRDRRAAAYTCPAGHVRRSAAELDDLVKAIILERLSRPDARDLLAPDLTGDTAALHAQDAALRARLDELGRMFADGAIDARQLEAATERIRGLREHITAQLGAASRGSVLVGVADAADPAAVWAGLDLSRRRAIIDTLAEIVVLKVGRRGGARQRGQSYFDPASVGITWKR